MGRGENMNWCGLLESFRGRRRTLSVVTSAVLLGLLAAGASAAPSAESKLAELAAKMPLRFEENVGQVKEAGVRYFARGVGYRLFLGSEEAVFSLGGAQSPEKVVRLHLAGGAEHPAPVGIDLLPTKSNYLRGNDPRLWHTGVSSFAGVRYANVYPGTDLVFSGSERRVEQTFFLAAGAEPRRIRLVYEGSSAAEVGKTGELILRTPGGELTADRPVAYQTAGGERRTVECRYELLARGTESSEVGFALGAYDRELPLVIDPVFSNSTFLGGTGYDFGAGVGIDGAGNIYIAGSTTSTDFPGIPTPGGLQSSNSGPAGINSYDGFVAKIDPTGSTLLYSTYLGGSEIEEVSGIAVDSAGNVYLTGYTFSSDFPGVTASSIQSSNAGGRDAFVAKLSPAGSALLYSTYLGGSGTEFGNSIAVDSAGNAYVTGSTGSGDFPGVTASSFQPSNAGGPSDAFVTKINAAGSAIVYSTYLGGSDEEIAYHIAVDTAGNALIVGGTCSTAFPVTAGSLAPVSPGSDCGSGYDGFVSKLNPLGTALVYSTFLGGEANDIARGLAVDAAGNAYVTGFTNSSSFTGVTAGSFQPANPGGYAAFLTKINAAGSATGYSTFLGSGSSFGYAVTLDAAANAYVTGDAGNGYPIVNADTLQPAQAGDADGFVTKVAPTGAVTYSTYFGGQAFDLGSGIAVDSTRNAVYVTGGSASSRLPGVTPASIQPANGGGFYDAFLVRIVSGAYLTIDKTADVSIVDPGGKITYTLAYHNLGDAAAAGASLTETVPDNTAFKPAGSAPGWSCTPSTDAGSTCTLALGTLPAGAGGTAAFVVKVLGKLPAGAGPVSNTACVHPGSNCSTVETPTTAAPILSITKTANFTEAKPGNVLRYTIKYFNTGNQDAAGLVVTDTVPDSTVFDPVSSTAGWVCVPNGSARSVCTFPVGNLAAGSRGTVVFAATLSTLLSNTACLGTPPSGGERPARKGFAAPACSTATTPLK
jgi:uncharacterized repeat protein (TIGR01451 family)